MDYGRVLGRAWQITWRWKVLWILGFLTSLGQGAGGSGNFPQYRFNERDFSPGLRFGPEWIAVIIAVAILALLIGIALWVVSIIARGGLIAGVQQVEDEGTTGFLQAWRVGRSRFWTLFGISVLTAIPVVVFVLILIVLVVITVAGAGFSADLSDTATVFAVLWPWLFCGLPVCCLFFIVMLIVSLIQTYADRAAILEGLGWIDAFRRGWGVIRAHPGPTLLFWLIFLVIGFVVGVIILAVMVPIAVPIFALLSSRDIGAWVVLPICGGGLLFVVLAALIGSIVNTFTSATWTLVYRELTAMVLPAAPAAPEAPAEL